MNLRKKKKLVAKVMNVGVGRVIFNESRLTEIKEAITRQDILDLIKERAITLKEIRGKKKYEKPSRRGAGGIRKKIKNRKIKYMARVRKQRKHVKNLKEQGKISNEKYLELRKKIKQSSFKDIKHLIGETK